MTSGTVISSSKHETSRRWAALVLSDVERDVLADAAMLAAPDPYEAPAAFREIARETWNALRGSTRDRVTELRHGASARPELYVQNLPCDPKLPPTPTSGSWGRTTAGHFSELLMVVFASELGYPIAYADQRAGAIFHDVYPTRANAAKVSSQSHAVSLGLHSEMFFHPAPPDFLVLHCLRSDPACAARTGVADLATIEDVLTSADRDALRQPAFALDLARLHGSYTFAGQPITEDDPRPCVPIISSTMRIRLRFEPALTTPTSESSRSAMQNAERAAESTATYGTLDTGGMLLVDNRRSVHSRSSFAARFDGTDRWLRRMMVATAGSAPEGAVVRSNNLDLLVPWRENGTAFVRVSYASAVGGRS